MTQMQSQEPHTEAPITMSDVAEIADQNGVYGHGVDEALASHFRQNIHKGVREPMQETVVSDDTQAHVVEAEDHTDDTAVGRLVFDTGEQQRGPRLARTRRAVAAVALFGAGIAATLGLTHLSSQTTPEADAPRVPAVPAEVVPGDATVLPPVNSGEADLVHVDQEDRGEVEVVSATSLTPETTAAPTQAESTTTSSTAPTTTERDPATTPTTAEAPTTTPTTEPSPTTTPTTTPDTLPPNPDPTVPPEPGTTEPPVDPEVPAGPVVET